MEFMKANGDAESKVIIKTDQEPSIDYLVDDIGERRAEGRTIHEQSPVQSKGSNGVVERGVGEIEGSVRAILLHPMREIRNSIGWASYSSSLRKRTKL